MAPGRRHPNKPRPKEQQAKDPRSSKFYSERVIAERDEEGFQWQVPTNTSNPARPRTKQAAYNKDNKVLRVEFRDGTPWEYYEVTPTEWSQFKRTASPGRYINRVLNSHDHGPGDWEP